MSIDNVCARMVSSGARAQILAAVILVLSCGCRGQLLKTGELFTFSSLLLVNIFLFVNVFLFVNIFLFVNVFMRKILSLILSYNITAISSRM